MENKNKTSEYPAFPVDEYLGASKRFYAACSAIQVLCSSNIVGVGSFDFSSSSDAKVRQIVRIAYEIADEMLKKEYGE